MCLVILKFVEVVKKIFFEMKRNRMLKEMMNERKQRRNFEVVFPPPPVFQIREEDLMTEDVLESIFPALDEGVAGMPPLELDLETWEFP